MRRGFKILLFLAVLACLKTIVACSSGNTTGSNSNDGGNTGSQPSQPGPADPGVIKGTLFIPQSDSDNPSGQSVPSVGNIRVSVLTQPNLFDDTDDQGVFEIKNVPVGTWCLYATGTIEGTDYNFGLCNIVVSASQGWDTGSQAIKPATSFVCSKNEDCFNNYGLPPQFCSSSLDENSCSISSSCGEFNCNGKNEATGESFCTFGGGSSSGPVPTFNDYEVSGSCETDSDTDCSQLNPDDWLYVRSGPNGFCKETRPCFSNADCPGDSVCFFDGFCFSNADLMGIGLQTCNPTVGCSDISDICLPVPGSPSCSAYCLNHLIPFGACNSDLDCAAGGGICYESAGGLKACVLNDVSACSF